MATLTENNTTIDKNSGAVLFKRSPELIKLMEVEQKIEDVNKKMDLILKLLGGQSYE